VGDDVTHFLRDARRARQAAETQLQELSNRAMAAAARRAELAARWGDQAASVEDELLARDEELAATTDELRKQIAELSRACALLQRERAKYIDLFHHAPDAYVVTDLNGVGQEANEAAGALLGVERGFLCGRPLIGFVARQDTHAFRSLLRELGETASRASPRAFFVRLRPRGLPVFVADGRASVVASESGKGIALRWALRRSGDPEVEIGKRMADAEIARMLNDSLRGPLTTITAWARILRAGEVRDDAERQQALGWIEKSAVDQQQTLDDLAELSDVYGETSPADAERIDLTAVLDAAVAALPVDPDGTCVQVEGPPDGPGAMVHAHAMSLQRVLGLLVGRAVEGTPRGGQTVVARVGVAGKRAEVHIEAPGGSRPAGGPGSRGRWDVRMAIAVRIVEIQGGHLALDRDGASAHLTFPIAPR
jgi:PAS domain S-box-containing protein